MLSLHSRVWPQVGTTDRGLAVVLRGLAVVLRGVPADRDWVCNGFS